MTRYYVYTVQNDDPSERINAFVEDPKLFAMYKFDPEVMEFSGVFVEADTPEEAHRVYFNPQGDDVFVSCEEPLATAVKRRIHNSGPKASLKKMENSISEAEEKVHRLRMQALVLEVAALFAEIAVKSSELSRIIKQLSDHNDQMTNQEIYEGIMRRYAEQVTRMQYRPRAGGDDSGPEDSPTVFG